MDLKARILFFLKNSKDHQMSVTALKNAVNNHTWMYEEALKELVSDGLIVKKVETIAAYWRVVVQ